MTRPRVFISYSREDRAFVDKLAKDLRTDGVEIWLDTSEIAPGKNWRMAIEDGLRLSSALLYVASAKSSFEMDDDGSRAAVRDHGIRVIPVIVDEEGRQELPPFLAALQWVDFRLGYLTDNRNYALRSHSVMSA